jgi:hypothetical protein
MPSESHENIPLSPPYAAFVNGWTLLCGMNKTSYIFHMATPPRGHAMALLNYNLFICSLCKCGGARPTPTAVDVKSGPADPPRKPMYLYTGTSVMYWAQETSQEYRVVILYRMPWLLAVSRIVI